MKAFFLMMLLATTNAWADGSVKCTISIDNPENDDLSIVQSTLTLADGQTGNISYGGKTYYMYASKRDFPKPNTWLISADVSGVAILNGYGYLGFLDERTQGYLECNLQ